MNSPLIVEALETQRGAFRGGPYSFQLTAGDLRVLLGANGSGKSTLLETLAGLCTPKSGGVRYGDQAWQKDSVGIAPYQRSVGILLQELGLWPHLTIEAQVQLVAKVQKSQISQWAKELELTELLSRRPAELSGGEAQRAALLRTLAADAAVLLLDEPVSDQFETAEQAVCDVVESEAKRGKIVLIATHRDWPGGEELRW